jgi:hypothetical protein
MKGFIRSTIVLTLIAAITMAVVFLSLTRPSHAALALQTLNSQNYAGYASRNGKFTSVAGSWLVPAVRCSHYKQALGIWVGIGGLTHSNDLEQDGIVVECDHALHPQYFAFFEILPAIAQTPNLPVKPGDRISASVTLVRKGVFNFQLHDSSQNWSFTRQGKKSGAHLDSADCIVEAVSDTSNHILPLAKFGTITISGCLANGKPINADPSTAEIFMFSESAGAFKAQPSDLSAGGTAFSVRWERS